MQRFHPIVSTSGLPHRNATKPNYIIKVEYEGDVRRVPPRDPRGGSLSLDYIQSRIRNVFQLPTTSELKLTYKDSDGDIITMSSDFELGDALIIQALNPLRLQLALLPIVTSSSAAEDLEDGEDVEPILRSIFTANVMPELLNHIAERVTDNIIACSPSTQSIDLNTNIPMHHDVTCDICGLTPISGPRYKSMKKFDYDLCGTCYDEEGSAIEYRCISVPQSRPGPTSKRSRFQNLPALLESCQFAAF